MSLPGRTILAVEGTHPAGKTTLTHARQVTDAVDAEQGH